MPKNNRVNPLLMDMYALTMAYGHWVAGRHEEHAVFEMFFRKNPFKGEFTVFAGIGDVLDFLDDYRYTEEDIEYISTFILPDADRAFFDWLSKVDLNSVTISAMTDGTLAFPRTPLAQISGPLAICQLLEAAILDLCGYASLVTTNAVRMRLAAGSDKQMFEFGLRRGQGPDGSVTASKYACIGLFDGTSNVLAGKLFGLTVKGTMAHAYVNSYIGFSDLKSRTIIAADGREFPFFERVLHYRKVLGFENTNEGELAAFISYAQAFPKGFLALVDTFDTLHSGVPNFICVAFALQEAGYRAIGIRLDSGDLVYLSKEARRMFKMLAFFDNQDHWLSNPEKLVIVASNDLDENILWSFREQRHEINAFGIGTKLVTCEGQPSLGVVYKLVEIKGRSRIKLSEEPIKIVIPGRKKTFRLYGQDGVPILDLMMLENEPDPQPGERILARHPTLPNKRAYVIPTRVEPLSRVIWDGRRIQPHEPFNVIRGRVLQGVENFREDHLRRLNPTPYKVSVSARLYDLLEGMMLAEAPVHELR